MENWLQLHNHTTKVRDRNCPPSMIARLSIVSARANIQSFFLLYYQLFTIPSNTIFHEAKNQVIVANNICPLARPNSLYSNT